MYRLPSNEPENKPLDSELLELSTFEGSALRLDGDNIVLPKCVESTFGSEKTDITFPVRLFQICTVPSQDAILPLEDKMHMSFTT